MNCLLFIKASLVFFFICFLTDWQKNLNTGLTKSIHEGEKMNQEEILEIEKKEYGFRLVINGSESYFIRDEGDWYIFEIENENREVIDMVNDRYENLGVKNIDELLYEIIKNPSETLKMLVGERPEIEKIVVEFD